jgi:CBS domain-containing protein
MTPTVICVKADFGLEQLTALLIERGISGAPVIDDAGKPVGIVSKTDLLRERFIEGDTSVELPNWLEDSFHLDRSGGIVADVMMPVAFTLRETDSIARAAALMSEEHIHRVPVVNLDGRVVGIVTTFDLARWIAS